MDISNIDFRIENLYYKRQVGVKFLTNTWQVNSTQCEQNYKLLLVDLDVDANDLWQNTRNDIEHRNTTNNNLIQLLPKVTKLKPFVLLYCLTSVINIFFYCYPHRLCIAIMNENDNERMNGNKNSENNDNSDIDFRIGNSCYLWQDGIGKHKQLLLAISH